MARKERIEYPGAIYHVISRGNYRRELFADRNVGEAFVRALFDTAQRCRWRLFAYAVMSNHYHLALQTPEPNLVDGMKWLQSTFATRFNRLQKETGHVFQGRYKALVIRENGPLLGLIDYIHLHPVRAGICSLASLQGYELCSFTKFMQPDIPAVLDRASVLSLCGLPDSVDGMRQYKARLDRVEEKEPGLQEPLYQRYCRGWFLGSAEAKQDLVRQIDDERAALVWKGAELKELHELRWEQIVREELQRMHKSESDLGTAAKGADWKVVIAKRLRSESTAMNPWIAQRLRMGHPNYVSNLVHRS